MRAAIYCRVSTTEQVQLDALKIQEKEAKAAVEKQGWILAATYVETESGTTAAGRLEYLRMLSDMSDQMFDVLVIKSEDRLNRNVKDWYLLIDKLTQADVKLFFYLTNTFYQPDNSLITGVKAILAEEYSRQLSIKENNAHAYRQQHGTSVIITRNTYGLRKNERKEVVIIEEEARIVRMMFELAKEGYGARSISNYLFNSGITNRAGKQFDDADIRRMIRNPLFMGTAVMNKTHFDFEKKRVMKNPKSEWIYHENLVPAIVEPKLWNDANEMLDLHALKNGRSHTHHRHTSNYDFSGKIKCACCGNTYYKTFRRKYSDRSELIIEWKCSSYLKYGRAEKNARDQIRKIPKKYGKGCDNWHINEKDLLKIMDQLSIQLLEADSETNLLNQIVKVLRRTLKQQKQDGNSDLLQEKMIAIEKKKSVLLDKLLSGVVSDEQYRMKLGELENQKSDMEAQYQRSLQQQKHVAQTVNRIEQIQEKLMKGGMDEIQRRIIMGMVSEMIVKENELVVKVQPGLLTDHLSGSDIATKEFHFDCVTCFSSAKEKQDKKMNELLQLLYDKPTLTNRQAAELLQVSFSTIRRWIRTYQKNGCMEYDRSQKKWIVKSTVGA